MPESLIFPTLIETKYRYQKPHCQCACTSMHTHTKTHALTVLTTFLKI